MSKKKHPHHPRQKGNAPSPGKSPEYIQAVQAYRAGRLQEAEILFQNYIGKNSNDDDAVNFAGLIAFRTGNYDVAAQRFREAVRLNERNGEYHNNLGAALKDGGDARAAIPSFQRAVDLNPNHSEASYNLGGAYQTIGEYTQAIKWYEYTLSRNPNFFMTHNNMACVYKDQGNIDRAIELFQQVIDRDSADSIARSNMLFCLSYLQNTDPKAVFRQHLEWEKHLSPRQPQDQVSYANSIDPHRRLRIGYVSPDFRVHSVAFFIHPIIHGHDRDHLEIFCYGEVAKPDEVTEMIMKTADHWRNTHLMTDEQVFQCIQNDRIDVLIDLAGHSGNNRLKIFAMKPAPVQITYLGYPNTTGLSTMDYRITDSISDPPGLTDAYYTEELIRLPDGFLCYFPPAGTPDVSELPYLKNGYITFGSFNNRAKINDEIISLWSELMRRTPGSHLILKSSISSDKDSRRQLMNQFIQNGIDESRIEILTYLPFNEHLEQYHRVDIALDTYPYNGTTTTCEALWMGVPVITQSGNIHAARVGASILGHVGLNEWIVSSTEDYFARVMPLISDIDGLATLRKTLRQKLRGSPLMDKEGLVATLDSVYRHVWHIWCADRIAAGDTNIDIMPIKWKDDIVIYVPGKDVALALYLLQEKPDWLNDEISFLQRVLKPGMNAMDIGAEYGAYTLTAATSVGVAGHVWTFETDRLMAAYLSRSIELNRLDKVKQISSNNSRRNSISTDDTADGIVHLLPPAGGGREGGKNCVFSLTSCPDFDSTLREVISRLDFLRVNTESRMQQVIDACRRLPQTSFPLILYPIRYGDRVDTNTFRSFIDMGFQNYRLIPGLGILAPISLGDKLDAFQQHLFCCMPEQAEKLHAAGVLVKPDSISSKSSDIPRDLWVDMLQKCPYTIRFLSLWQGYCQKNAGAPDWRIHQQALSAYTASRFSLPAIPGNEKDEWDMSAKYLLLNNAYNLMTDLLRENATVSRILTAIRLAADLGYRADAAGMLNHLYNMFDSGQEFSMDEPFLSVSQRMEAIDPGRDVGLWLVYSVLEARETFRSLSSYFTGEKSLTDLELMRTSPFFSSEMDNRRQLINRYIGK